MEQRTSDVVFSGRNYTTWRTRIQVALAKEGLQHLMVHTPEEEVYLAVAPKNRSKTQIKTMTEFERRQGLCPKKAQTSTLYC